MPNDMTEAAVETWRKSLIEKYSADSPRATTTAMRCHSINCLCDLALEAIRMKRGNKKKAYAVAAEKLRQIAESLDAAQ